MRIFSPLLFAAACAGSLAACSPKLVPLTSDTASAALPAGTPYALLHFYRPGKMTGFMIGYDVHVGDSVKYRARNGSRGEVRRRVRISNPYHLAYTPDGKFLVVASLRRDQVDIYDARDLSLLQRLRVGDKPSHIAFDPESRFAYVTLQGVRAVLAIDMATRQPVWQAEVGREPAGIMWNRGRLIVGVMGESHFAVLNPETRQVERHIPIGRGAHTIFPSPDGRVLYGTSRVDSRIIAIDPETLAVTRSYEVPGGPDCIAFDPEGRIWVTLRWIRRVGVLDPRTGQLDTIEVGRSPHGVFVHPVRAE